MKDAEFVSLQILLSALSLFYFIRIYRMSPKRVLLIGVFAFTFGPLVILAFPPSIPKALLYVPLGYAIAMGVTLAIWPPRALRVTEQNLGLVAITECYAVYSGDSRSSLLHFLWIFPVTLFSAYHLLRHERLEEAARFTSHCALILSLFDPAAKERTQLPDAAEKAHNPVLKAKIRPA